MPTTGQLIAETFASMPPWQIGTLIVAVVSLAIMIVFELYPKHPITGNYENQEQESDKPASR